MFYYNPLVLTREAKKSFKHNSLKLEDSFGKISGVHLALRLFSTQGIDAQYCGAIGTYDSFNHDEENLNTSNDRSILKMPDCLMTVRKQGELKMSNFFSDFISLLGSQRNRMKEANIVNKLGSIEFSDLYQLEEMGRFGDLNKEIKE